MACLPLLDGACAHAQGKLDARYVATLAGIPLGKGAWVIDITDNEYVAAASGMTTGLVRVFTGGQGSGAVRGAIVSGNFVPASYSVSITTGKKTEDIRIALNGGNVKEFSITPETPSSPKAVPVLESHRRNVIDPMTASFARAAIPSSDQRDTPGSVAIGSSTPSPSVTNSGQTRSAGVSTVSRWSARLHAAARVRRRREAG